MRGAKLWLMCALLCRNQICYARTSNLNWDTPRSHIGTHRFVLLRQLNHTIKSRGFFLYRFHGKRKKRMWILCPLGRLVGYCHASMCMRLCVCVYAYASMCMRLCVCVYVYTSVCVCVYVYASVSMLMLPLIPFLAPSASSASSTSIRL